MICAHLQDGTRVGFHPARDPHPDPAWAHMREAWCDACDRWWGLPKPLPAIYNLVAGRPRMVCGACFEDIQEANERPGRDLGWWER